MTDLEGVLCGITGRGGTTKLPRTTRTAAAAHVSVTLLTYILSSVLSLSSVVYLKQLIRLMMCCVIPAISPGNFAFRCFCVIIIAVSHSSLSDCIMQNNSQDNRVSFVSSLPDSDTDSNQKAFYLHVFFSFTTLRVFQVALKFIPRCDFIKLCAIESSCLIFLQSSVHLSFTFLLTISVSVFARRKMTMNQFDVSRNILTRHNVIADKVQYLNSE